MIIECPQCEAKVHARVVAELSYPPTDIVDPYKYLFLQCPSCKQPLLGYSELSLLGPAEEGWEDIRPVCGRNQMSSYRVKCLA